MSNKNKNIITKKNFPNYLVTVVTFIMMVMVTDFTTGNILSYFFFRQKSGWDYSTKYSIEDTKADVVIFGASRAQQQYNPQFIEDSLKLTCYNAGRDGMPFFYHYAVLQGVLKRYTPKIILLDCEYGVLKNNESSYERISCLLPYYKNHPELRSIIELRSPFEKYKLLSKTYPFNSLMFKIVSGNLTSSAKENETIKGYVPLFHSLNEPIKTIDYTAPYELDSVKVNMFQSFIDDCKKRGIKLFIICSPYYINPVGTDYSIKVIKEKAVANKIQFLDYSTSKKFIDSPNLFDDTVHVNTNGSKIFSSMLAGDLKRIIINE